MKKAHIEIHISVILFGMTGLFGKFIVADSTMIVFGRAASAAIAIFIGMKICKMNFAVSSRRTLGLLLLSGLILMVHWVTFFHSIQISTVAIGVIGFSTFPIFVTFLEPVFFKQRLRKIDIVSGFLVVTGLFLVSPKLSLANSATVGLAWGIFSGAIYAFLALINRHLVKENSFLLVAFFQHSTAAFYLLPFIYVSGEIPDYNTIWLLIILGVICTALPQTLFIKSLKELKAQLASIVIGLEPVYAIFFAAILLGEIPDIQTIVGSVIVLGAVMLAMKAHSVPRKS